MHAMTVNTTPYPLDISTTNAHNKHQTPLNSLAPTTNDPQTHHQMAHDQPHLKTMQHILTSPANTSHAHPNYYSCHNHPQNVHSRNNNHASINTIQTATTSCERHGSMQLHSNHNITQATSAGYASHHLLPLSNGRDFSHDIRADIQQALQPFINDITTFLTTAKTQATVLLSHLQCLLLLLTTIYTIIVPST